MPSSSSSNPDILVAGGRGTKEGYIEQGAWRDGESCYTDLACDAGGSVEPDALLEVSTRVTGDQRQALCLLVSLRDSLRVKREIEMG
jgi:hypothetical protein